MKIFIMRHGEASNQSLIPNKINKSNKNNSDVLRPLTEQGKLEANKIGGWIATMNIAGIKVDDIAVLVSPYLRAKQTCSHVVNALIEQGIQLVGQPQTIDFITPAGNIQQAHDFIDGLLAESTPEIKAILLISHMPFVSYLVAQLTNSQNMPVFATGAIAHIDYDMQLMQGQLVEMVSPEKV